MRTQRIRIITVGLVAALLGVGLSPAGIEALAVTQNDAYVGVDASYSQRVEEATSAYHEAEARLAELNSQMEINESLLAGLEQQLPEQRQRAKQSLRALYKLDQSGNGLIDLLLSAEDFNSFIATMQYLDIIQERNLEEVARLVELNDILTGTRASLLAQQQDAEEQVQLAEDSLADAEAAREAARQASLARSMEEEKERQAALEAAREHEGETFSNASGREVVIEAPAATPAPEPAPSESQDAPEDQAQEEARPEESSEQAATPEPSESEPASSSGSLSSSREQFIETWGARIDAYNAGYPLGGYGRVFAEAAYDSGVDPRWSPAIARIESSSGLYCFADHNAWGWGSASWPDWETAIRSQVSGLGYGYGYTLTLDAARTYCPPNADFWFSCVDSGMKEIWPTDQL